MIDLFYLFYEKKSPENQDPQCKQLFYDQDTEIILLLSLIVSQISL